jgi:hypothetical protein
MSKIDELFTRPPAPAAAKANRLTETSLVPSHEARRVLTSLHTCIGAALSLAPIAAGLMWGGGGLLIGFSLWDRTLGLAITAAVGGLLIGTLSILVLVYYQQFLASRYYRLIARIAFARRKAPLVRSGNQAALFLDVIPRSHWGKNMLEPATDLGFFLIDHESRALLFEGDTRRYCIPFESIKTCRIEEYCLDSDRREKSPYYVVILDTETTTGPREVPFACRHLDRRPCRAPQRHAQALALCTDILKAINA